MDNGKVLIVSERWWPDGTGGILASHLIAQVLQSVGFKLTVLHGTEKPIKVGGINYIYTGFLSVRDKHRLWANCLLLSKSAWFLKMLRECDIVYIPRYCYPIIHIAKNMGKRVIVHLHDYQPVSYNSVIFSDQGAADKVVYFELLEHGSISRTLIAAFTSHINKLCRIWLKDADAVICVSRRQAEIISKRAPELASRLKIVYNPLPNMPFIKKNLGDPTFLYVGGDSYVKGFHILLKASRKILKEHPHTKLLLTGVLKKKDTKLVIDTLNMKYKNVYSLLGFIPRGELQKLYAMSCALLFPSIWEEPLPYAVVESMLAGTLPIASKVGGVPEIVGGTPAEKFMFTPINVNEFVNRMECVLSMGAEQLTDIGLSLREEVLRRFNQEATRNVLVKVFFG
ncbi:MAG: glycosyltransferase family 4 protein [Sulfolobales archaeon]|nr:glycosyltransferase family 4 protein [Sulfolobales archaeon]